MVFHGFLSALLIFASLMQSFEEHYLNLNLFLLSQKKKRIIIIFSKQRCCYGHISYLECLCTCANICAWEAVLCVSSEHFILDFSLQGFPKKTEITSKHGMPLTSNPWQSSGFILLCSSAKHIPLPSDLQEAAWENGEVIQGRDQELVPAVQLVKNKCLLFAHILCKI